MDWDMVGRTGREITICTFKSLNAIGRASRCAETKSDSGEKFCQSLESLMFKFKRESRSYGDPASVFRRESVAFPDRTLKVTTT